MMAVVWNVKGLQCREGAEQSQQPPKGKWDVSKFHFGSPACGQVLASNSAHTILAAVACVSCNVDFVKSFRFKNLILLVFYDPAPRSTIQSRTYTA